MNASISSTAVPAFSKVILTYRAWTESNLASIVSGPKAGMFRIRFGDKALPKQETDQLMARVQGEKIVTQALPAE